MKNLITAGCLVLAATVAFAGPGKGPLKPSSTNAKDVRDEKTGVRAVVLKSAEFTKAANDLTQAFTAANKRIEQKDLYRIAEHLVIADMKVDSIQAALKSGDAQKVVVAENVLDILKSWSETGNLDITAVRDASGKVTSLESGVFVKFENETVSLLEGFIGQILTFSDSISYEKAGIFTKSVLENTSETPEQQIRRASVHLTEAGGKDKAGAFLRLCTRKLNAKLI